MNILMSYLSQPAPEWLAITVLSLCVVLVASLVGIVFNEHRVRKNVQIGELGGTKEVFDGDEDDTEFIGQVIDIFEDFLDIKDGVVKSDDSGVRIAGSDYDFLADRISDLMIAWF